MTHLDKGKISQGSSSVYQNLVLLKSIIMNESSQSSNISHYLRGGLSSMIAISLTYPLNKLSMRQAMEGVDIKRSFKTIRKEGVGKLYKGILPPLIQKSVTCAIMFGTYFTTKKFLYAKNYEELSTDKIIVISGMTSAILESFLTPFERIQTLLTCQTYSRYLKNTKDVSKKIINCQYPLKEFYRGYSAVIYRNTFSTTLFFSAKECFLRKDCCFNINVKNEFIKNFVQGAVLGAICSTFSYPINVTRYNMQRRIDSKFISFSSSFIQVLHQRNYNLKKFYSGAGINIVRSFISWGIVNCTYEYLRYYF